ncbi:MAG: hypothetical protein ACFFDF_12580 [Candidatus Odinarchaeota archaeon]
MIKINKYYWLIPLIGGVLSLIGLLIPTWYSPPVWVEYWWLIGLIHHITGGNVIAMAPLEISIPSLIAAILIVLCSILIILNSLLKSREKTLTKNTENLWISMAIIEIAAVIFYIIGIQVGYFLHTDRTFWDIYQIRFGTIIPFISAGLTLTGAIIGKRIK